MSSSRCTLARPLALAVLGLLFAACRQDMHDQPRHEPQEGSSFFSDGRADRPRVAGTIPRGGLRLDKHFYEGKVDGQPATSYPIPVDRELLERGRERYGIFCAPCHDESGSGRGMIVRRGLKQPTSFHAERLRTAPPGYTFDVITNGFGAMFDYRDRIPARDRWAIVAWVQTLQLSQNVKASELPADVRERLAGR